jgi:hypothetical protein
MFENVLKTHAQSHSPVAAARCADSDTRRPPTPTPSEVFFDLSVILAGCLCVAAVANLLVLVLGY